MDKEEQGSVRRIASAWLYLLREASRGFVGELSQSIARTTRGMARYLKRELLLSFRRRWRPGAKAKQKARVGLSRRGKRFDGDLPIHSSPLPPPFPPRDTRPPSGPPPR